MKLWCFITLCSLIIPITMLLVGILFLKNPPKEINGIYGYRTHMSMKNKDTWEFAHHYCGKLWKKFGLLLLFITIPVLIVTYNEDVNKIGITSGIIAAVQTLFMIISIFPVEKALKKNFDKDGKRK